MITVYPVPMENFTAIAIHVQLPKTDLLILRTEGGYVMCGALDIGLLRDKLADRGIVAARAVGVRTIDELLHGHVESCTQAAEALGIREGMPVREALARMQRAASATAAQA
ncbi:hypothetical protein GCM10010885_04050 [Alicyclobacillus cellulosilyticus]|uniref:DUF1805 domain-containing protein n=1 Tax=Alicyclobacillus cellulosilyticus TaxID=1003997 RepID=A0A917K4V3_9BACL|nr:DUF1805 domain-containing protein [Alicyclobacillus cellulosilyticus]GGI97581.1 hypothetical protein GCM10010885_04050 [Alicyclobacillus cellulosilyticus]